MARVIIVRTMGIRKYIFRHKYDGTLEHLVASVIAMFVNHFFSSYFCKVTLDNMVSSVNLFRMFVTQPASIIL